MINLLPEETKDEIRYGKFSVDVVKYGILALVIIVMGVAIQGLGIVVMNSSSNELEDSVAEKQSEVSRLNSSQSEAVKLSNDINQIQSLIDRRVNFSELIQQIGAVLPSATTLSSLSLGVDNSEPMQLSFEVDTQEKAAILRKNLEDSETFSGADIQSISEGEANEQGVIQNYTVSILTRLASAEAEQPTSNSDSDGGQAEVQPGATPGETGPEGGAL